MRAEPGTVASGPRHLRSDISTVSMYIIPVYMTIKTRVHHMLSHSLHLKEWKGPPRVHERDVDL